MELIMRAWMMGGYGGLAPVVTACLLLPAGCAAPPPLVPFTRETLGNGLQVIYAPMHAAPVVHVEVLYHVGSRDERPDRQGFAHMFEHMMFRGSAHVQPQQHMQMIGKIGGYSNAYTSFDRTVYINTLPASYLETALYLEADRMASFKVSDAIYQTERRVVTEEWRMQQNRPYGNLWDDFLRAAFTTHSYRWSPIGNMDHLRAAVAPELQEFFNRYYLPNNAVLVIAGDIDPAQARAWVHRYFGWIPAGAPVERAIPAEPPQTQPRVAQVDYRVPLPDVVIGYRLPPYRDADHDALEVLATILGGGRTSRLMRLLVSGDHPSCVSVTARDFALEDAGFLMIAATALAGHDPAEIERAISEAVAEAVAHGVTEQELATAKTVQRVALVRQRQTASGAAAMLGEEALVGGDAGRVNTATERLNAVTIAQVQAVAAKYLGPGNSTTLRVAANPVAAIAGEPGAAPATAPADAVIHPRVTEFPAGYPTVPPLAPARANPEFLKGTDWVQNGVHVIVMPDPDTPALPLVNWSLTMRRGPHSDPPGQAGLTALTAALVRRGGAAGLSFDQINQALESRGISLETAAEDDYTRISGSCLSPDIDYALDMTRKVLREPTLDAGEFAKLKQQRLSELQLAQESPNEVATRRLLGALYGSSALGVSPTTRSVGGLSLDQVRTWYRQVFAPDDAVLILSGDVTVEHGRALAAQLLAGWEPGPMPAADYRTPPPPPKPTILLIDRPEGRQSTVRLGLRAYDVQQEEKFAGTLSNQIMSAGIDSRLGRYVRAQKGLAYSVWGTFRPGRHGGSFVAGTDTTIPRTADALEAMFQVFDAMGSAPVTDAELADAKLRVAGSMVMSMQTVESQAGFRVEGILNGYPVDYYDRYPARVAAVTQEQVRQVVGRYVRHGAQDGLVVVVVAPASQVRAQLERFGEVRVEPMPARETPVPAP
jgi:zinc protease